MEALHDKIVGEILDTFPQARQFPRDNLRFFKGDEIFIDDGEPKEKQEGKHYINFGERRRRYYAHFDNYLDILKANFQHFDEILLGNVCVFEHRCDLIFDSIHRGNRPVTYSVSIDIAGHSTSSN